MKQLLIVALAFGGICYVVTPSRASEPAAQDPAAFAPCDDGDCVSAATCKAFGGTVHRLCAVGMVCCTGI